MTEPPKVVDAATRHRRGVTTIVLFRPRRCQPFPGVVQIAALPRSQHGLNRIQRAQEMLPLTLDRHGLQIGVALEIAHWLGPAVQPRKDAHLTKGRPR